MQGRLCFPEFIQVCNARVFYPLTRNGLTPGPLDSLTGRFGKNKAGMRYFPPKFKSVSWVAFLKKAKEIGDITQLPVSRGSRITLAEVG